jgi:hypothetical protein
MLPLPVGLLLTPEIRGYMFLDKWIDLQQNIWRHIPKYGILRNHRCAEF